MAAIPNIINYLKVSEYLASIRNIKGGLFGSGKDTQLANKLYAMRKNLEWLYTLNPNDPSLQNVANYLYSLCDTKASSLISGGGGSISPLLPTTLPAPIDFLVDASSSFILAGATSATINAFIGYNLQFIRNQIPQSTVNLGGGASYFSWNKLSGLFTFSGAAQVGDIFQLNPMV